MTRRADFASAARSSNEFYNTDAISRPEWWILVGVLLVLKAAVLVTCVVHRHKLCAKEAPTVGNFNYTAFTNDCD